MEKETFSLKAYNKFLHDNQASIAHFKSAQQSAFDQERARWEAAGSSVAVSEATEPPESKGPGDLPPGWVAVFAEVPGNMWKVDVKKGQRVTLGDRMAIIESMKMEIAVLAPAQGVVGDVFCAEGRVVSAGQLLFSIQPG